MRRSKRRCYDCGQTLEVSQKKYINVRESFKFALGPSENRKKRKKNTKRVTSCNDLSDSDLLVAAQTAANIKYCIFCFSVRMQTAFFPLRSRFSLPLAHHGNLEKFKFDMVIPT